MAGRRLFRALIMGAPGSGKGTISERIVSDFGLKHLSSGDLLRSQILQKTDVGLQAQKYIDEGALVPDETMVALISAELKKLAEHSWLLDGFPRTRHQAEALHKVQPLDTVISLNVPFQVIIDRIKDRWVHLPSGRIYNTLFNPPKNPFTDDVTGERLVQRADDAPDAVRKRLEVYQASAGPVIEFYRELGVLEEFSGSETNKIWPHVRRMLQQRIQ
ncbi:GTP:AMP phosphotransferase AK3, mitochondrial-like [Amphibalanus amphitrite]|uniref:GTP:AMP phosphotransferase AK3, mitochondrial-like n=1 Tax=Amphibalanus amphitrite TaxID=1232801 RepID=UPI001C901730|nr:GTP:AMP phosphotransferase AK3, mitochondrial-like [Amphibalanus amphitrite]XP_043228530.1 GTP:AMP phosphotransferase AK3, mitochondrial-like [Amphibalanus amphitrite]